MAVAEQQELELVQAVRRCVHDHDEGEGDGDAVWAGHAHEEFLAGGQVCVHSH